jgi:Tol biopolymer transport system component/predicted Ser/Thr protein kinase
MPLTPGTKLGPYEIQAAIGSGGMGEVYRARDTRLGRDVAVKVLSQHLSSNPEFKERFDREARAISSLNHPLICILHDVGHQDGVDFLVMEYLEGESLAQRIQKGPVPLKDALKIAMEVCEALDAAHRAGIVHRDLKPGNIMLTKSGAKLMDFGLAKAAAFAGMPSGKTSAPLLSAARTVSGPGPLSPLTGAGHVVGTVQYISPEQIEGLDADARSDIFALGGVLYEMVTGMRPFDGKSQISVASAILEKDPPPISKLQPVTPPAFEHVVNTCLAKNPDDRFQSARDVRLELKWIAEGSSQLVPLAIAVHGKSASTVLWRAVAACAVLAAAILAVFLLFVRRQNPLPVYTTVSFREGILQAARFSRDGQTIVYSGEWEGEPPQVTAARVGSPESRSLGIPSGTIASVSSSDELAVLLGCEYGYLVECAGTLATVSLAGGSPRNLAEHVAFADWAPDGKQLAISVYSSAGTRLEFPPGHVLYQQKTGWIGHPRFSPDGSKIAFENHPTAEGDSGTIEVVDLNGKSELVTHSWLSLEGVAWSPDGKEIWFAGTNISSGWADAIHAITLAGKERIVLVSPSVRLHDISKDGRILLSHQNWRRQMIGLFPGDAAEHPYSWLDDTSPTAISADGRTISFFESGAIYYIEGDNLAYYRPTDGSPAVRLGAGLDTISPDGKFALWRNSKLPKLLLQPLGPGEARELPTLGAVKFAHEAWSDDGRHIVYEAQTSQDDWGVYTQAVAGGTPVLLKTAGHNSYPVISPDGSVVALREQQGGISLYAADGQSKPLTVKGVHENEYSMRFANAGKSLLVAEEDQGPEATLTLVDISTGKRQVWKKIATQYRSGFGRLLVATPDLKYYAYCSPRYSSDLYLVENVR